MTEAPPLEMVPPGRRPVMPHPDASPEWVIRTFLEGVREPDVPATDVGIVTAYHLAAPSYRARAGFFEGFERELRSPFMSMVVGHDAAARSYLEVNDAVTEATQRVLVTDDGEEFLYEFTVEKQSDGKYEGCWLVSELTLLMEADIGEFEPAPTVEYEGIEIKCERGEPLRDVIHRTDDRTPHNRSTRRLNCGGSSLCGTCAVEVVDTDRESPRVSAPDSNERRRLSLPPFRGSDVPGLRLACQTAVHGDLRVRKHGGRFGQKREADAENGWWYEGVFEGDPVPVTDEEYEQHHSSV